MVGNAGNAPVRHFRFCFVTPDLQAGNRITSRRWLREWESHPPEEVYEASLCALVEFPAVKLVESVGNAPTSTCLQGRCIACLPRPQRKTGKSPWCCPRQAGFWRPCRTGWCATYWKIKRAGSVHAPGPRLWRSQHWVKAPPSNKEQTPPGDLLDPSPRFHGGCFGV